MRFANVRGFGASHFELQSGGQRLLPMEGMRGMAAFLVFFVHFWQLFGTRSLGTPVEKVFHSMGTLGHRGVDIFFALSGFIIYGLLLKGKIGYFEFVKRRIHRLYPAFTFVFILYTVIMLAVPSYSKLPSSIFSAVIYLCANYLMLPGLFPIEPMITVAWSLSYEVFFYLTIPLICGCLSLAAWPRKARICFFLVLSAVWLMIWPAGSNHPRMAMFLCGILVRECVHLRFKLTVLGNYAAILFFLACLTMSGLRSEQKVSEVFGPIIGGSKFELPFLFLATFVLGYFALVDKGLVSRIFSWDWLRWFGNMSYSYYLVHGAILSFARTGAEHLGLPARLGPGGFLALCLLCFGATVVGGSVIFLAIEKPMLFRKRESPQPLPEPAKELQERAVAAGSPMPPSH